MDVLRAPDSRFDGLPGYAYTPKYHTLPTGASEQPLDLRMHYVDEGPQAGRPILMLHGEPSWSYLYRHMIPIVAEAGYRAIAPDLVGFGRSDKLADRSDYSYAKHDEWLESFVLGLDLRRIILVCQDWGGLLGLRLVARHPERFDAVVAANTFLPRGGEPMNAAFTAWQNFSQSVPEMHISKVIQQGCTGVLSKEVCAAYDAPFPDESYKAGARAFPMLVPTDASSVDGIANQELWEKLANYDKPFVTAFSDEDPITRGGDKLLQEGVAGAKGQSHTTVKGAGHFLQEDRGPELAAIVLALANSVA